MGRSFDKITDQMVGFIERQHLFFVGSAPTDGKPNIVRLFGTATVARRGDVVFDQLRPQFPDQSGIRSIIVAAIHRTSSSCGFSVPFMDFVEDRPTLANHWAGKDDTDLPAYWAEKNATSIDGLPAL